jgi:hypothetical protein
MFEQGFLISAPRLQADATSGGTTPLPRIEHKGLIRLLHWNRDRELHDYEVHNGIAGFGLLCKRPHSFRRRFRLIR